MIKPKANMYSLSKKQWNPYVGCGYGCSYCTASFQAQLRRWASGKCQQCMDFKPHTHPERLNQDMPRTRYMQFIFTCSSGDINFCPTEYLELIVKRIRLMPDRTFLIQSKNPITFQRVKWPSNVVLGTTIETNRSFLGSYSKAPSPQVRKNSFLLVEHKPRMVTLEPIMKFDLDVILRWIGELQPSIVWIGFDSKNTGLPEPSMKEVRKLTRELAACGFPFLLKTMRRA